MNASKIQLAIDRSRFTKAEVAKKCEITRRTLDNVISGADAKISTIETIARVLNVRIGFFFDEGEMMRVETSGDNSPATIGDNNIIVGDPVLVEKVKALEKLLEEKERTIQILMNKK